MRLVVAVLAAFLLQGCAGDEGVSLCKADLEGKLKAPATLELVAAYRGEMPAIDQAATLEKLKHSLARDEARFDELGEAERGYLAYLKNAFKTGEIKEIIGSETSPSYATLLTYDAENSFGAPLRGHHWCWIANPDDGASVFESGSVDDSEAKSDKALMKEVPLSWWPS